MVRVVVWWSIAIYLIVDTILVVLYCAIWIICFKKSSIFRALALSVIPSVLFLFSGIMSRSILLLIAAILFAPSHILLSYKNAKWYWSNSSLPHSLPKWKIKCRRMHDMKYTNKHIKEEYKLNQIERTIRMILLLIGILLLYVWRSLSMEKYSGKAEK